MPSSSRKRTSATWRLFTAAQLIGLSPRQRAALNAKYVFVHPEHAAINGVSHIEWTGKPVNPTAHRHTGTSARMAQLVAKGKLAVGDEFIDESIIGSLFKGRVESATKVAGGDAIVRSIAGWVRMTGINTIFIDDQDLFAHGFIVK